MANDLRFGPIDGGIDRIMTTMTQRAIHADWVLAIEDGKPTMLRDRHVVIEDSVIAAVTRGKPAAAELIAEGSELLVMPGFLNLHNHCSASVMFRGLSEDMPAGEGTDFATELVYGLLMPMGAAAVELLSAEEMRVIFDLGLLEIIKGGTTTLMEMFRMRQEGTFEAARDMGLRFYGMPYLMSHAPVGVTADGAPEYQAVRDVDGMIDQWQALHEKHNGAAGDRLRVGLGPHGTDTCDADMVRAIRGLADAHDSLITIHLSQTESEQVLIEKRYGKTPSEYLDGTGLLGPDLLAAHCIFASDADLELLRRRGVTVANCPLTFGRGGVYAPYHRFADAGLRTVIGTDGYRMEIVGETRAAALISKLHAGRSDAASAHELVDAVTRGAANYLGRPDLGRIAPGARADLIAIDLAKPHFQPVSDPLKTFLWNADRADVTLVMVDGQVLVEDAVYRLRDEADIIEKGVRAVRRFWDEEHARGVIDEHFFASWYAGTGAIAPG